MFDKEYKFFVAHERLLLVLGLFVLVFVLGNKYINYESKQADAKNAAAQAVLQADVQNSQALAAKAEQQAEAYKQLFEQTSAQIAQLEAQISANDAALHKQQTKDKTLPVPDLLARWQTLAQLQPSDVQLTTSGINVSESGARQTVSQLEAVPVLQDDVKNLNAINDNKDQQIQGLNLLVGDYTEQIGALNQQIADGNLACKTQVAAVKADARKGKVRWFKIGFVTGFIAGLYTGHAL